MPRTDGHRVFLTKLIVGPHQSLIPLVLSLLRTTPQIHFNEQRLLPAMVTMGDEEATLAAWLGAAYSIRLDRNDGH